MNIIDPIKISELLQNSCVVDKVELREILDKALTLSGLNAVEVAALISVTDQDFLQEIFHAAHQVKEAIYGQRLVIFAPLYISNFCTNECLYCAFRTQNTALQRRSLTQAEIANETKLLVDQGHKRILLVAGEVYTPEAFQHILDAIATVYSVKSGHGAIRRVNVNIAPLSYDDFVKLHAAQIGTYQIFQETYHRPTYREMHLLGRKADYDWRLNAIDRAMQAGIDDVGIGVLFGLTDWRFEILALLQHIAHLDKTFGVGPHTISVPRLEPASGSLIASNPPHAVSDSDFLKIVAILRLAVPYTGIIMSTRETAELRRATFNLGVSQISAGSRTNPGGYQEAQDNLNASQFSLGDHRSLDEVICDIAELGFIPSFCTACYRSGRTGEDFMKLAKCGRIKEMCEPNALATFVEYLTDYASPQTLKVGEALLEKVLAALPTAEKNLAQKLITRVKEGKRDVYV
jgi:2-iminoacetate synthase